MNDLGRCTQKGPCEVMRGHLLAGGVRVIQGVLYTGVMRIADCPWCGEAVGPALRASWPWRVLGPVLSQEDGSP